MGRIIYFIESDVLPEVADGPEDEIELRFELDGEARTVRLTADQAARLQDALADILRQRDEGGDRG
jgi:hypothetical protein